MSIVTCSKCGSKISSMAKMCLHCGHLRTGVADEQSLVFRQRQIRDRIYHLRMTSYSVLAVILAAFGWFWWESGGFEHRTSQRPFILMGLGGLAYLVVRTLIYQAQRKQKELKRGIR